MGTGLKNMDVDSDRHRSDSSGKGVDERISMYFFTTGGTNVRSARSSHRTYSCVSNQLADIGTVLVRWCTQHDVCVLHLRPPFIGNDEQDGFVDG